MLIVTAKQLPGEYNSEIRKGLLLDTSKYSLSMHNSIRCCFIYVEEIHFIPGRILDKFETIKGETKNGT